MKILILILLFTISSIFLYCQNEEISIFGDSINSIEIVDFSNQFPKIQGGDKLEVTIDDTLVIRTGEWTDTTCAHGDYVLGEKFKFIHNAYIRAYDTIIVYFDSLTKDTMMFSIYNGYRNNSFKEWYRDGRIKTITDTKTNINKSWYPNGKLRWDKVPNSDMYAYNYSFNEKNRSWFPDGKIMSEHIAVGKDTLVYVQYYNNGNPRYKSYALVPGNLSESDDYIYPAQYYFPINVKEEFYCFNGQLMYYWKDPLKDNCIKNYPTYHCNGKIKSINEYYDFMQPYGKYEEFYENGVLKQTGSFTDYDISKKYYLGVDKILEWNYYNREGELIKTEIYNKQGELIKTKQQSLTRNKTN